MLAVVTVFVLLTIVVLLFVYCKNGIFPMSNQKSFSISNVIEQITENKQIKLH